MAVETTTAAVLLGAAGAGLAGLALFVGTGVLCTAGLLCSTRGLRRPRPRPPTPRAPALKTQLDDDLGVETLLVPPLGGGFESWKGRSR